MKRCIASAVLFSLVLALPSAHAAKPTKAQSKAALDAAPEGKPVVAPKAVDAKTNAKKDAFDFDLLDKPKAQSQADLDQIEETDRLGKKRRTILLAHQVLGFTLLGVGTVNFVLGILNYWDRFGGGGYTSNYATAHIISSMTTTAVFTAAGLLALFAPDPYEKPGKWDTARIHRILMALSTAGMVAEIVLGIISTTRYGDLDQRDWARTHLIIGTATWAFSTAGGLIYLF